MQNAEGYCIIYHEWLMNSVFIPQDQLSADMYNFASKEGDYARYYVMVGALQFSGTKMEMWFKVHFDCTIWACLLHHVLITWTVWLFCFVLQLLEAQADYHRRSLAALEAAIPTIQIQQGE